MKDLKNGRMLKTTRISVLISALVITVVLSVFCAVSLIAGSNEAAPTKDEIAANISAVLESGRDYEYAALYLYDFGIKDFDAYKFKVAENFFDRYSIYEQKPKAELAAKTAQLYLEFYFDATSTADTDLVTDRLITCFVEATGDKYAIYRTASEYEQYNTDMSGTFVGIGVYVRYSEAERKLQVIEVIEGSGAEDAGILAGDLLTEVDGIRLTDVGYDTFVSKIRGEEGTTVNVKVLRGDEELTFTPTRKQVTEKTVKYSIDEDLIGYLQITAFKNNTATQFKEAIDALETKGCRGIIFDLRDNPGGYLLSVVEVIDYIVPVGTRIASYTDSTHEVVYEAESEHALTVPITVIFNEYTASAGELFSAAMRDFAAMNLLECTTVGINTYSKGVMQNTGVFNDGSTLTFTIAYYNPPCDVNYDGIGVSPDVEVEWIAGTDTQLDAAYTEITKLINNESK